MTDMDIIASHRMPDGTEYRVSLKHDDDPLQPEDDGQWPILRVEYRHYDYVATAFNQAATPYVAKFNELFERLRELSAWERYAKIFLGASQVHEWGFNQGTDYSYIAFDTPEWRKAMGWEDDAEAIEKLAGEKPLAEIQAWVEGSTWGIVTEKRWNPDEKLESDEDWSEEESVWGYYGRQYAEEAAKEELQSRINYHKVVHRYTEHEKITPHQSEIDAILTFLEAPGEGLALCKWNDSEGIYLYKHSSQHQRIVFEHFNIDYKKIEEERELMFKRLQMDASKQAGVSIQKAQEAKGK